MYRPMRAAVILLGALLLMAASSASHAGAFAVLTFTKAFGASNIVLNGSTSLTYSLSSAGAPTNMAGWTDTLPAGLVVATPNGLTNSCAGVVTAVAGSSSISHNAATIPMGTSCAFSVNVTGTTTGIKTSALTFTSNAINSPHSASASVTVNDTDLPIPYLVPLPGVAPFYEQPNVLNLSAGAGPPMTTCLMGTLTSVFGADATYLGQSANGGARALVGGKLISFYPLAASRDSSLGANIVLGTTNVATVGTSCGKFSVVPAVYNLPELGSLLNNLGGAAEINPQGVVGFIAADGRSYYFVRPDYLVTLGAVRGPSLVLDPDGRYRFTDSAGYSQVLQPAFYAPELFQAGLSQSTYGVLALQLDGSGVFTRLNGQQFGLLPDMAVTFRAGSSPGFWQDASGKYHYTIGVLEQGVSIKAP